MNMRAAAFSLLLLAGCVLPPLEWTKAGYYNVPFDRAFEVCKDLVTDLGYRVEVANQAEGAIETDWRIHKTAVAGQGFRDYIKLKLYSRQGGFTEVWVMAIKQQNENPSGPTSNPEYAHWGIDENFPVREDQVKLLLAKRMREEANR